MEPTRSGPTGHTSDTGLSVGEAAARLGVAASTLRTWQRRYGLAPTARSSGGHRRYLPGDVAVLDHMHRLLLLGHSPSRAAQLAMTGDDATDAGESSPENWPGGAMSGGGKQSSSVPAAPGTGSRVRQLAPRSGVAARSASQRTHRRAGGPGGQVLAVPGASPAVRGLARAAAQLDGPACVDLIEAALGRFGVEQAWDLILRPVLVSAGAHWARTGEGVDIEHLLSESTIEALRSHRRSCPAADERPPVLLACAPADQHSLPLHVLAAALAERRQATQVLGPRVPAAALSSAVRRTRARSIFLWAQIPDPRNRSALTELPVLRPRPFVVVGGPGWGDDVPAGAWHADSLEAAARVLVAPQRR